MKFEIENLVSGESTGGRMAAFGETTSPGSGPPMHVHREQVEIFHVIRGRHLFSVDGVETEADAGACLLVPAGAVHTFKNISTEEGMLHYEVLPAGSIEEFFSKLVAGDFDLEKIAEFFSDYGIELAGPPLS